MEVFLSLIAQEAPSDLRFQLFFVNQRNVQFLLEPASCKVREHCIGAAAFVEFFDIKLFKDSQCISINASNIGIHG